MVDQLFLHFLKLPLLGRVLLIAAFTIIFFGVTVHLVEPDTFPTIFDGIWWAVITAATVGYGDFVPKTFEGKMVGIIFIAVGVGFVSTYFVALATSAVQNQNKIIEGKAAFVGKKEHMIIVGWNERSRYVIQQLIKYDPTTRIVLIDESLKQKPVPDIQVHFIQGSADQDFILKKAGIENASTIIITADPTVREVQSDMRSILQLIAVKGLNPTVYTIVEILTQRQLNNAERAGADEIIESNYLTGSVLMNTLVNKGISQALSTIINQTSSSKVEYKEVSEDLRGQTFAQLLQLFYKEEVLLIGIKKGGETLVNPPFDLKADMGDELLLIRGHYNSASSSS